MQLRYNIIMRNILFFVGIIVITLLIIYVVMVNNCKGLQIARLHNGKTIFSIINNKGDSAHEPQNCTNLIIRAIE